MIWNEGQRQETWQHLQQGPEWDLVIIGGGITGAGILQEATRQGLRALLVEQRDFAWGTSSRSSKMVHGGLRYLKQGNLALVRESVREREHLLKTRPGLVEPLGFLMPHYRNARPGRAAYRAALTVYGLLAGKLDFRYFKAEQFLYYAPHLATGGLQGGFQFHDAQTDDARLVLRVIFDSVDGGGYALNYCRVEQLLRQGEGERVSGVRLVDTAPASPGRTVEVRARQVINATGAWAGQWRGQVAGPDGPGLRPLRGSHLVFAAWRLPVAQVITFSHPQDGRPVFVYPWEGAVVVGTTDLDHRGGLETELAISPEEVSYLMAAVNHVFPGLKLDLPDVLATWAGVRPVVASGQADPSRESRDSVIWPENGLTTVTGGKLTTFEALARQVLDRLEPAPADRLIQPPSSDSAPPTTVKVGLDRATLRRLQGRYGQHTAALLEVARPGELEIIPGTRTLWAEVRWAARAEGVQHLEDLLLRRVRLGLLLAQGGQALLPRLRAICQPELGWDDSRWEAEQTAYLELCRKCYGLPPAASIPDWHTLAPAVQAPRSTRAGVMASLKTAGVMAGGALLLGQLVRVWRNRR